MRGLRLVELARYVSALELVQVQKGAWQSPLPLRTACAEGWTVTRGQEQAENPASWGSQASTLNAMPFSTVFHKDSAPENQHQRSSAYAKLESAREVSAKWACRAWMGRTRCAGSFVPRYLP